MKVTIKDIAQKLNVSQNTVSKALRGADGVSDALRNEIIKTASQLGYNKYTKKKSEVTNKILVISRVERYQEMMFWAEITFGMRETARDNNAILQVTTITTEEEKNDFICPELIEGKFNGIIFLGTFRNEYIKKHLQLNIPIILVDHYMQSPNFNAININNHHGVFLLMENLVHCGHKKIGFVGDIEWSPSFYERYLSYLQCMKFNNLEVDERFIWTDIDFHENMVKINHNLKLSEDIPTAFVCANDLIAVALIRDLSSEGILVPETVSVVGFDDIDMCTLIHPSLTTVRVPKKNMGICAVEELIKSIQGIQEENDVKKNVLLSTEFIERDSVKRLN